MKKINEFILLITLLTPCMPKIAFTEKISMYPLEILLLIFFPILIKPHFFLKRTLLFFWLCISFSTIFSFIYGPIEIGGAMRCIKGLIYIPLIYIASTSKKYSYNNMPYILITAAIINVIFHISQGFDFNNLNIWNSDLLMSGLSRWSFSLASGQFVLQSAGGSHGIWGDYCVVALCATWLAYLSKKINKLIFVISFIATVGSLSIAVSREAFLVLICLLSSFLIANSIKNGKLYISTKAYFFIAIFITICTWIVISYGEHLALVQKMLYTMESFNDSGKEQNLNLRVGAWTAFGLSLLHNPWAIFTGYGFNITNYAEHILSVKGINNINFVTLPESFFVQAWGYGGLICLIYSIIFWLNIYRFIKLEQIRIKRFLLLGLVLGLIIASALSGAAIISDLLYGQFLIFIGFLIKERKNQISSNPHKETIKIHKNISQDYTKITPIKQVKIGKARL